MPIDYSLGKVYTIVNSVNDTIYVGSTVRPYLSSRIAHHRDRANHVNTPFYKAMNELGSDKFRIVLHHEFPCKSKNELEAEEYRVLNAYIAAGTPVYNSKINGKHSEETKQRLSERFRGERSVTFSFGCQSHSARPGSCAWSFIWYENGRTRTKSCSCRKYGHWGAKSLVEAERKRIYPDWEKSVEEEAVDSLMAMEV
jgi:hypothetical protein